MTKIVKIRLENFKAIEIQEMTFNGCSAVITGRNNSGKSSFLRGIADRARFSRPQIKVRHGATEGEGEMVLDNGERLVWQFDDAGKDKLTLISQDGAKSNVTKELGAKLFPRLFDIDRFIESTPKDQVVQLQKIVGLDFTEIDKKIDDAYKHRYKCNEESERFRVKLSKMMKCDPVKEISIVEISNRREQAKAELAKERTRLNELYASNKKKNDDLIEAWEKAKREIDDAFDLVLIGWENKKADIDKEIGEHNKDIAQKFIKLESCRKAYNVLSDNGYTGDEVTKWLGDFNRSIKPTKNAADFYPERPVKPDHPERPETPDPLPSREELDKLEKSIETIDAEVVSATENNIKAKDYDDYIAYMKEVQAAELAAEEADQYLQKLYEEKREMIAGANFPDGIYVSSDPIGVTVDGFPLDRSQLSTSKLYTAALRIAAMNLGEVKSLHFDASFLDKNSLHEIHEWAVSQDLQLLIERPDYEGGEIEYTLIEG